MLASGATVSHRWGMDTQPRATRTTGAFDAWAATHLGERHRREGLAANSTTVPECLRPDYRRGWYGSPSEAAEAPAPRRPVPLLPVACMVALCAVAVCFLSAFGVL